ncbi:MAG: oxygen-independent coproporphyrinogen III oxidase [Flavobacteriales bacterium]|nr:oxygen-independent coproporphyrinogen III oxidase [Crocinitomicaceae bacterium]NBX80906.1 oxygen-independent coproporphyrinogen III oxidase [Flavobacteriales bacterium]NCA19666.1 oxygen-independent coproporphyrinogen III oxidase [Crocinitomicaceae bacterium]
MNDPELVKKYNIPGPRYTSYPTVPFWKNNPLNENEWSNTIQTFIKDFDHKELSLYIHLPFCEQLCTFCGCHKRITKNHQVEEPYIDTLLKEWDLYKNTFGFEPTIKELHFGGGTPTFFKPSELIRLLEGIFEKTTVSPEACELSFEAHPGSTSEEHLRELYRFGFRRVSFGIQDYDADVQKAIHRVQSFELVKTVHELSANIGYTSINHDLVYGLPKQNLEIFEKTIDLTLELKPERIALYSYAHVPWIKGTGQRGYSEEDLPQDNEKRALYEMAYEKLLDYGYLAIGMDHFALPTDALSIAFHSKKLHRNFMGYTTKSTNWMIGLGMSSISDCWIGFAQNDKTVEDYQIQVNEGKIPVFRGHLLTKSELIIRKNILDLMCHFETKFSENESFSEINSKIKERLKPMIADELVAIENNVVSILPKGLPFVRNACMAFDQDLASNAISQQLFSKTI